MSAARRSLAVKFLSFPCRKYAVKVCPVNTRIKDEVRNPIQCSATQEFPSLVKRCPAYQTQNFITAFTRARHLSTELVSCPLRPPIPFL